MFTVIRAALAAAVAIAMIAPSCARAQTTESAAPAPSETTDTPQQAAPEEAATSTAPDTAKESLPPVVVKQGEGQKPPNKPNKAASRKPPSAPRTLDPAEIPEQNISTDAASLQPVAAANGPVMPGTRSGSLTVPTVAEARAEINQTPGGVALVPGTAYQESTPAVTLKDILDYVPGVFVQPKWGEDSRLSIRGSGLSRNFHLRSVQLFMDGIPMNTSDGYGDFQEIDPTVYKYVEVYKGANALQYGANSLGGAINFVMPSGYTSDLARVRTDFGSFDFKKVAASSGAVVGPIDYFINTTWQEETGFRDHSAGELGAWVDEYRLPLQ